MLFLVFPTTVIVIVNHGGFPLAYNPTKHENLLRKTWKGWADAVEILEMETYREWGRWTLRVLWGKNTMEQQEVYMENDEMDVNI